MIDYDDSEVIWWRHEIEYIVRVMQSSWEEITVESVMRELHDAYGQSSTTSSDELLELCKEHLRPYSDPFDGLGDANVDLKVLTESGKNALISAVTAKSKLYKSHATRLDAYLEKWQEGNDADL